MRLFDTDKIGLYLDTFTPRVEVKGASETKLLDLTLRLQPLTPELAAALDPDVRALLFSMGDATPKPKIKSLEFKLNYPKQDVRVFLLPESESASIAFFDADVSGFRARTEKGVDGYGLVFYMTVGPLGEREREQIAEWHTQQRFVTFAASQATLQFDGKADAKPEKGPRRVAGKTNGSEEAAAQA